MLSKIVNQKLISRYARFKDLIKKKCRPICGRSMQTAKVLHHRRHFLRCLTNDQEKTVFDNVTRISILNIQRKVKEDPCFRDGFALKKTKTKASVTIFQYRENFKRK